MFILKKGHQPGVYMPLRALFLVKSPTIRYCPIIMQTCPCNEQPHTPHFYIEKLGCTGVYIFFLFLLLNTDCGYSLEPPQ